MNGSKILVAYFSCSGVTARAAQKLAKAYGGELFEIAPAKPYTAADLDWTNRASRSSREMADEACRPAIARSVKNMSEYSVVFVGFPIWWYVAPRIVQTFLESYDFSGKTVVPFFTSGGSGAGNTDAVLHKSCSPSVDWRRSKRLSGDVTESELKEWADSLRI